MSTRTMQHAVSGYARGAASARLRPVAPLPLMARGGVCPLTASLHADAVISDVVRIDRNGLGVQSSDRPATQLSTRQFEKHDPGSPVLRPPV